MAEDNSNQKPKPFGLENNLNGNQIQGMFLNETVTCANDLYDKSLVESGRVKDLNEAKGTPRHIVCHCGKCQPKFL